MRFQQKKKQPKSPPKFILIILGFLCISLFFSIYTATNVHFVINNNYEGDDLFNYVPIQIHTNGDDHNSSSSRQLLYSILKRTSGDKWIIPSWEEESKKERNISGDEGLVRWANFTSTTGVTRQMAIHPHFDFISRSINRQHHWVDCDILPSMWNETQGRMGKRNIYVEIGVNIGSCVMEMLLSTDAPIIAFEPHPKNQLCLKKTIARLEPELQNRIVLVPIALGDEQGSSTIYSAKNNMGNSVVGQIIKDYDAQEFNEEAQFEIQIERFDSILKLNSMDVDIKLMKLDAQGYECRIIHGMGTHLPQSIQTIKFEAAQKWTDGQNCTDLLPRFRELGFDIYKGGNIFHDDRVKADLIDLVAKRSQE